VSVRLFACHSYLSHLHTCRNARGKVWGTDEINVEGWKPLKRLQGHSSGSCVQSPELCRTHDLLRCNGRGMVTRRSISCLSGSRLSSYGLVWVYTWYISFIPFTSFAFADAFRSERLRKLDLHQGFVKGVCWDPVGEFLATQSDDRSVKIWKTSDWSIEAEVTKPFEDSPGSTFFRRLRCEISLLLLR
jgi:protein HIRA/HIR1